MSSWAKTRRFIVVVRMSLVAENRSTGKESSFGTRMGSSGVHHPCGRADKGIHCDSPGSSACADGPSTRQTNSLSRPVIEARPHSSCFVHGKSRHVLVRISTVRQRFNVLIDSHRCRPASTLVLGNADQGIRIAVKSSGGSQVRNVDQDAVVPGNINSTLCRGWRAIDRNMLCRSRNARKPPCNAKQSPDQATLLTFTLGSKVFPLLLGLRTEISRVTKFRTKDSHGT